MWERRNLFFCRAAGKCLQMLNISHKWQHLTLEESNHQNLSLENNEANNVTNYGRVAIRNSSLVVYVKYHLNSESFAGQIERHSHDLLVNPWFSRVIPCSFLFGFLQLFVPFLHLLFKGSPPIKNCVKLISQSGEDKRKMYSTQQTSFFPGSFVAIEIPILTGRIAIRQRTFSTPNELAPLLSWALKIHDILR